MKRKGADSVGDYDGAVSHNSLRMIFSLQTQHDIFTDVDMSRAFVQGDLLPGDGHNGNAYSLSPPGYGEESCYIYCVFQPLYGMPSAAQACHTTMSTCFEREGHETVGFEKSMW